MERPKNLPPTYNGERWRTAELYSVGEGAVFMAAPVENGWIGGEPVCISFPALRGDDGYHQGDENNQHWFITVTEAWDIVEALTGAALAALDMIAEKEALDD